MALQIPSTPAPTAISLASVKRSVKKTDKPLFVATGPPKSGKSSNISTIPKLATKKHLYLTADTQTMPGLLKFHTERLGSLEKAEAWIEENCTVVDLLDTFDPSDIRTAPPTVRHVKSVFAAAKAEAAAGRVAEFVVEHFDVLVALGTDACHAEFNIPKGERLNFLKHFGPRSDFLDFIEGHIEGTRPLVDATWLTGYGQEVVTATEPEFDAQGRPVLDAKGNQKANIVTKKDWPRWLVKRNLPRNCSAWFDLEKVREESEIGDGKNAIKIPKYRRYATVLEPQHPRFSDGQRFEVTGKGFAAIFDPSWWQPA